MKFGKWISFWFTWTRKNGLKHFRVLAPKIWFWGIVCDKYQLKHEGSSWKIEKLWKKFSFTKFVTRALIINLRNWFLLNCSTFAIVNSSILTIGIFAQLSLPFGSFYSLKTHIVRTWSLRYERIKNNQIKLPRHYVSFCILYFLNCFHITLISSCKLNWSFIEEHSAATDVNKQLVRW